MGGANWLTLHETQRDTFRRVKMDDEITLKHPLPAMAHRHRRLRHPTTSSDCRIETPEIINPCIRQWILRILVLLHGHRNFLTSYGFSHGDVAEALGLTDSQDPDDKFDPSPFLRQLRELLSEAEEEKQAAPPINLVSNIGHLTKLFSLSSIDAKLLTFAVCIQSDNRLYNACESLGELTSNDALRALAIILALPEADVRRALNPRGLLSQSGLVSLDHDTKWLNRKLDSFGRGFIDAMLLPQTDPLHLMRSTISKAGKAQLNLDDYSHLQPALEIAIPYLRHALTTHQPGVNILIHGAPGTGKSQLVRTLAKALKTDLFEVVDEDEDGDSISGLRRMKACLVAQKFLMNRKAILVFDEAEDAFGGTGHHSQNAIQQHKSWLNRVLENNPTPTLWISNRIYQMDNAFIRRFDMVIEAPVPPRRQREKILRKQSKGLLTLAQAKQMAEHEHLAPAVVARISHVMRSIQNTLGKEKTAEAMQFLINNSLEAQGLSTLPKANDNPLPKIYDPAFLRADADLASVARGLAVCRSGRLCLYGPPGTGKTAYGHWLANQLEMPLLIQRASDLMSPYVGMTEKNIAKAFQQAQTDGALLLIDEVDSFLQDRRNATHNWESSMVNEMLTRMESFPGVFIASTNLMDGLDQAALRRFDLKVKFDFLNRDQAWQLLCRHCVHLGLPPPSPALQPIMGKLSRLTPGDFAAALRQHRFRPLATPDAFVSALQAEVAVKEQESRPIGFV